MSICRTEQWHSSAAAAGGPRRTAFLEQPGWESAARSAVRAGRPVVVALAESVRAEDARAARELVRVLDGLRPFPEV
ncbi:hypothetical protein [Streptomyces sp. NPDC003635]